MHLLDVLPKPKVWSGDCRSDQFRGYITSDSTIIAYLHMVESSLVDREDIPFDVRLAMIQSLARTINHCHAKLKKRKGAKFGLFANVTLAKVVRTADCKFDYRLHIAKFGSSWILAITDPGRKRIREFRLFSPTGELIRVKSYRSVYAPMWVP